MVCEDFRELNTSTMLVNSHDMYTLDWVKCTEGLITLYALSSPFSLSLSHHTTVYQGEEKVKES